VEGERKSWAQGRAGAATTNEKVAAGTAGDAPACGFYLEDEEREGRGEGSERPPSW